MSKSQDKPISVPAASNAGEFSNHINLVDIDIHTIKDGLIETEQGFKLLLANSFDGIVMLKNGLLCELNQQLPLQLGYSREELLGQPLSILTEDQNLLRIIQGLVEGNNIFVECSLKQRLGQNIAVEIHIQAFSQHNDICQLLTIRDISAYQLTTQQLTSAYQQLESRSQELQKEKELFEILLHASGDGIYILDQAGNLLTVNQKFCDMLGHSQEELLAMNIYQFDAQYSVTEISNILGIAFNQDTVFESKHRRKDGSIIDVEVSAKAINHNGQLLRWNASRDITARKKIEAKLTLAASVFTHAKEGIMITEADGTIMEVNDTFSTITGYQRAEIIGKNPRILQSKHHAPAFYQELWQTLLSTGQWTGEIWNRKKCGENYPEMLTISAVYNQQRQIQHYVALFTDITDIVAHEQQLQYFAHFDTLTGLPNRVLFSDRLQQALLLAQRHHYFLAVVFLDVDGFKGVNDSYGHEVGDLLLIELAKRIKAVLRQSDSLARFGGDEFVLVLSELELASEAELIVNRILMTIAEPVVLTDLILNVSCSIGLTLYPHDKAEADQLIRHADQAMYSAKQLGKNRYCLFDVNQDEAVKSLMQILADIYQGFEQQQFVLYYQPKVNMKLGKVIGVEALIRWQHPLRGLLLPNHFLPMIEDQAIGVKLGLWVIETALQQMSLWHQQGLDICVSVNIGANVLQQADFVSKLSELLARYPEILPAKLELEILETSALADIAKTSDIMRLANNLGVSFSLDDFGTGFSSLAYLKRLPTNQIKIDQSFVRDMLIDTNDLSIVTGVVSLANSFRRSVIAEGVSHEQGELLLALGCDYAQGFCIAKPMPAELLPDWLRTWRAPPAWISAPNRKTSQYDLLMVFLEVEHRQWANMLKKLFFYREDDPQLQNWRFEHWHELMKISQCRDNLDIEQLIVNHELLLALSQEIINNRPIREAEQLQVWGKFEKMLNNLLSNFRNSIDQSGLKPMPAV